MQTPQQAKLHYLDQLALIAAMPIKARAAGYAALLAPDVAFNAFHPVNHLPGADRVVQDYLAPLHAAFPDLERRDNILIASTFKDGVWTGATGHLCGTFNAPWMGTAPTGGAIAMRYGEFCRWNNGRIVEVYLIIDLLDFFRQAKQWPLGINAGTGLADRWPEPARDLGCACVPAPAADSARSLALVEAMIAGLMSYDGKTLESMGMERFWHPEMMWYGPGGIGTSRRLKGFQDVHQRAFLAAFPDRVGGDHKARLGDGPFVGSTGWPSVRATHRGPWLGAPAINARIEMRVMDFWARDADLLRENWVFIDQLHLLLQMGVDGLAAARRPY